MEVEAEVARLEQLELELIQKLQNTQVMQKTAYDDLENALNGNMQDIKELSKQQDFDSPGKKSTQSSNTQSAAGGEKGRTPQMGQ